MLKTIVTIIAAAAALAAAAIAPVNYIEALRANPIGLALTAFVMYASAIYIGYVLFNIFSGLLGQGDAGRAPALYWIDTFRPGLLGSPSISSGCGLCLASRESCKASRRLRVWPLCRIRTGCCSVSSSSRGLTSASCRGTSTRLHGNTSRRSARLRRLRLLRLLLRLFSRLSVPHRLRYRLRLRLAWARRCLSPSPLLA